MCCDAPDAPAADPRQGEALLRQSAVAERMADYAIQSDQSNRARLARQDELNEGMYGMYMRNAATAQGRADEQYQYFMNQGRPMLDQMFGDARNFDSEGSLASLRGKASADVEQAFANQQMGTQRALNRMGVNPGSNRAIAAMAGGGANAALAKVGTANQMTEQRKLQAVGLRQQAANVANGFSAQSLAQVGAGQSAMGGAAGLGQMGMQNAIGIQGATQAGFGAAGGMYGNVASGFGSIRAQDLQGYGMQQNANAASSSGLGSLVGTLGAAAIFASDRRLKKNISQIGARRDGLPIYSFEYTDEARRIFGYNDGTYVGFMADEVEAIYPEAVVVHDSGYKVVNYSMVGV